MITCPEPECKYRYSDCQITVKCPKCGCEPKTYYSMFMLPKKKEKPRTFLTWEEEKRKQEKERRASKELDDKRKNEKAIEVTVENKISNDRNDKDGLDKWTTY